tara:strand:- start:6820 stop:7197 length:378 start_codon:yes stop_codon:yes gene_type:complete
MTIQAGDVLSYNGKKTTITAEPLKPYLETRTDVSFIFKSTALVRGYIGVWEIKNKKLYLVSLVGFINNNEKVDLKYLFPNITEVFAVWFSGDIRIPEEDIVLNFSKGTLIDETPIDISSSFSSVR